MFLQKSADSYDQWLNVSASKNNSSNKSVSKKLSPAATVKNEEVNHYQAFSLECMRLALNFLINAQKYVEGVDDGTITIKELAPIIPAENESLAIANAFAAEKAKEDVEEPSSFPKQNFEGAARNESTYNRTNFGIIIIPSSTCDICAKFKTENDKLNDSIQKLTYEKQEVEEKLTAETKAKLRIKKSKEIMDQEVEELTSSLFDQANVMVIKESRARDDLNIKNKDLLKTISSLKILLETREHAMVELKKSLYSVQVSNRTENEFDSTQRISTVSPRKLSNATDKDKFQKPASESGFNGYTHTIVSGYDEFRSFIGADGIIFKEFQDFIRTVIEAQKQTAEKALSSTMSSAFIKRCLTEDIEPCLWYSYQVSQSTALPTSTKKKLLDLSMKGQIEFRIFIPSSVPETPANEKSDEKITNFKSFACKDKCFFCTIPRDCEYEMRLGPVDSKQPASRSEWFLTCRFCRDRCCATIDFFTFLSYLRQGLIGPGKAGSTILSLFRQVMWLRRRMHLAKVGSCSMFESEVSAITGIGAGQETDKYISIVT